MARRRHRDLEDGRSADAVDVANRDIDTLLRPADAMPRLDLMVSPLDNMLGDVLPADRREFSFHEPERFTLEVSPALVSDPVPGSRVKQQITPLSSTGVGFRNAETVAICVRRKMRREVLFANRKTGRGAKSRRRQRRYHSDIRC